MSGMDDKRGLADGRDGLGHANWNLVMFDAAAAFRYSVVNICTRSIMIYRFLPMRNAKWTFEVPQTRAVD